METNNSKKYRSIILILIVVNLGTIFTWWYLDNHSSDDRNDRMKHRYEKKKDFFESTLGLDSVQKDKFDELNHVHFEQLGVINNEIDSLKLLIKEEIVKPNTNEDRIGDLFSQIANKRTSIDTSIFYHFKELRSICRPNQKVEFDSLMVTFFKKKERFSNRN